MVCACYLLFKATYFTVILGFPLYNLYLLYKQGKTDKKWAYYFFFLTLFSISELTLLVPIKWLLNKIDYCMFPTLKALFALSLYCKGGKGINFIEEKAGKYFDLAFLKLNPKIGGVLDKIGVKNKDVEEPSEKPKEE